MSLKAMSNCSSAGMVCRNTNDNSRGCCCNKSQLPSADDADCVMDEQCIFRCVEPKIVDGQRRFPRKCGTGTYCPMSSHGEPQICAVTLHPRSRSKKHGECCGDPDASPEEQTDKGCCNHGFGIDCMDPHHRPCCLGVTNSVDYSPDALGSCQRECSASLDQVPQDFG